MKSCKMCDTGPRVPFDCPECGQTFIDKEAWKPHFKREHTDETFPCLECDEVFDCAQKRINHVNKRHTDKFKCLECGQQLASNQNLVNHIERTGHDSGIIEVVAETGEENNKKRKAEEMDPIEAFLDNMSDRLKNYIKRMCASKFCANTRIVYGLPGGENEYCSGHKDEIAGLVYHECPCRYKTCFKGGGFMIGGFRFCDGHKKQLVAEGLPDPNSWPKVFLIPTAVSFSLKIPAESASKKDV